MFKFDTWVIETTKKADKSSSQNRVLATRHADGCKYAILGTIHVRCCHTDCYQAATTNGCFRPASDLAKDVLSSRDRGPFEPRWMPDRALTGHPSWHEKCPLDARHTFRRAFSAAAPPLSRPENDPQLSRTPSSERRFFSEITRQPAPPVTSHVTKFFRNSRFRIYGCTAKPAQLASPVGASLYSVGVRPYVWIGLSITARPQCLAFCFLKLRNNL